MCALHMPSKQQRTGVCFQGVLRNVFDFRHKNWPVLKSIVNVTNPSLASVFSEETICKHF